MKISPITAYRNTFIQAKKPSFKGEIQPSQEKDINKENPKALYNKYFYTIPSTDDRTYTSFYQDLIDIPCKFKINTFDDVPCPSCGKIMMPKEKYAEFYHRIDTAENEEYLGILEEYKEYMRPVEESVFEEIKTLSHGKETNDLRTLIVALRDTKLPALQKVQLKKTKLMKSIAKSLPEKEKAVLLRKLNELEKSIKQKKSTSPFRRKRLVDEIRDVKVSHIPKYNKLQDIAKSFPTSSDMNSAWIVKYSGKNKFQEDWNSRDIALRMLCFSVPNTDHILARDIEENHDDLTNYMAMHKACNEQKSNKSFLEWYYEDKHLHQASLEAYFKKTDEIISDGKIDDKRYDNYVANATQLIYDLSQGKVDIRKKDKNINFSA